MSVQRWGGRTFSGRQGGTQRRVSASVEDGKISSLCVLSVHEKRGGF